jgi:hypothetical protein
MGGLTASAQVNFVPPCPVMTERLLPLLLAPKENLALIPITAITLQTITNSVYFHESLLGLNIFVAFIHWNDSIIFKGSISQYLVSKNRILYLLCPTTEHLHM